MLEANTKNASRRIRRLCLAAQGLLHERPFGSGLDGTRRAIQHLGYVQIDSISVVARAHHHVLQARVPKFAPAMTNQLLNSKDIFEYWAHAAAFLPMEDFRFSLPYKQAIKAGQVHWYKKPDQKLMQELLARIRSDGPLKSRDLEQSRNKGSGWWDWKPAKKAIEQLYMCGDLMICDREGFQKSNDLTERVLPANVDTTTPDTDELAAYLLDQQLRSSAFVSLKGITYLRRGAELRNATKALVNARVDAGELERVRLDNDAVYLCKTGTLDKPLPRVKDRLLILSPFDNSVIQRERLEALFNFNYQLECYLPEAKRQFGYFSLPLLFRDKFFGRMDCKAHRKTAVLEIKNLHVEPHQFDDNELAKAFSAALRKFAQFQGCESIELRTVNPARLRSVLSELESLHDTL